MTISQAKISLRAEARKKRCSVSQMIGPMAADMVAAVFRKNITPAKDDIIAGYWPKGSELDCRPLLHGLSSHNITCCLPVVTDPQSPLTFLHWHSSSSLITGTYGIMVPRDQNRVLIPTMVLTPLLAFDTKGYRLGYGGGYYDRTIELIRHHHGAGRVRIIGVAFEVQRVDNVPHDIHDQPLDGVVTETEYYAFPPARGI